MTGVRPARPRHGCRIAVAAAWGASTLLLAAVFAAYLQPALVVTLANQLWACF